MFRLLKKAWIPLVIVVVVAVASFLVVRIRGYFGHDFNSGQTYAAADDPEPFNPKVVKYEIFGHRAPTPTSTTSTSTRKPQRVDGATLPWSLTLQTTAPAVMPEHRRAGRRQTPSAAASPSMTRSRTRGRTNGVNAQTFCLVKSA